MELHREGDAITWTKELLDQESIQFHASDMRRERSGFHARVAIIKGGVILDYDSINIARREERVRLTNSVHKMLGIAKNDYPAETLQHDLGMFCLALPNAWEEQRFSLDFYDVDEEPEPLRSVLYPYIIDGGGTIFFGDPGAGKSYTMIAMACSIGSGCTEIWRVEPRPVLYVNMERSPSSLQRRFVHVARALKISGSSHQVSFLHARGMSFNSIARKVKQFSELHENAVGFFDSISRGGQGSLIEDDVANRTIDFLNGSFDTWGAIGHTNRSDKSHSFGSMMWDAGEDVGVKLTSEKRLPFGFSEGSAGTAPSSELGICLSVEKENDLGYVRPFYFALLFQDNSVVNIRTAKATEFPALLLKEATDEVRAVREFLNGRKATIDEIMKATGIREPDLRRLLSAMTDEFLRDGSRWFLRARYGDFQTT